jgi:type II secretory pathway pseudopilin PulG
MKSLATSAGKRKRETLGFSLIEMVSVIAILIVLASITFISIVPLLKQQRVNNAYNTTLSAMRTARDNAVSQRTSYRVDFATSSSAATVTVSPTLAGGFQGSQNTVVYQLPSDVRFDAEPQVASTPPPDGYGTGSHAIDFGYTANGVGTGGQSTIYFCPDGSAQDAEGTGGNCAGSWDGGVVYIARPGELTSSRAISLWGGTGRIRGWRLYSNGGGGYQWVRQ